MQMSASQPTSHQEPTAADRMQAEADRMQAEADRMRAEAARMQAEANRMQPKTAATSSESVTTLRGSSVGKVNTRRVGQVVLVVTLVTLLVLAVVFLVAGIHRNNQISSLQDNGVPAIMTVTACSLLIGGSGSTPAGDICQGNFTLNGHLHSELIPGMTEYRIGEKLHIKVVPSDPALLAPASVAANEPSAWSAFVLPAVLFLAFLLLLLGWIIFERRHGVHESS
jgi:uncharacterized membrane protein